MYERFGEQETWMTALAGGGINDTLSNQQHRMIEMILLMMHDDSFGGRRHSCLLFRVAELMASLMGGGMHGYCDVQRH